VERHLKLLGAAAEVCTEPAYGWLDDDELRFIFCRTPVAATAELAVHLLVGPRSPARAARVLALYGSPTWWAGEPLPRGGRVGPVELPEISLRQFEPSRGRAGAQPPSPEQLLGVVQAVLRAAGSAPVLLHGDPDAAVATMAAVTQTLPTLTDLVGFSTWEPAETSEHYDVLGRAGRGSRLRAGRSPRTAPDRPAASCRRPRCSTTSKTCSRRRCRRSWHPTER
jgi:hypothetical protein